MRCIYKVTTVICDLVALLWLDMHIVFQMRKIVGKAWEKGEKPPPYLGGERESALRLAIVGSKMNFGMQFWTVACAKEMV